MSTATIRPLTNPTRRLFPTGAVWRTQSYCRWYLSQQQFRGSIDLDRLDRPLWVPDNERQKPPQVRQKIQSHSSSDRQQDLKRPPSFPLPTCLRGRRPVCAHPTNPAIASIGLV